MSYAMMPKFFRAAFVSCHRSATAAAVIIPMMAGMAEAGGMSGVRLDAQVHFRHYELVKMGGSYFTLETEAMAANPHHVGNFDGQKIVVVL